MSYVSDKRTKKSNYTLESCDSLSIKNATGRCFAHVPCMLDRDGYMAIWMKVACDKPHHTIVVCNIPAEHSHKNVSDNETTSFIKKLHPSGVSSLSSPDHICPQKSRRFLNRCILLVRTMLYESNKQLEDICDAEGGKMPYFDNTSLIHTSGVQRLSWRMTAYTDGYPYPELAYVVFHLGLDSNLIIKPFLFNIKGITDGRYLITKLLLSKYGSEHLSYEVTNPLWKSEDKYYGMSTICVLQVQHVDVSACGSRFFTCGDGSCIMKTRFCDHALDCKDGSDELNCTQYSPGICCFIENKVSEICSHMVALTNLCDGINHCANKMDEVCPDSLRLSNVKMSIYTTAPAPRKAFILHLCQAGIETFGDITKPFFMLRSFATDGLSDIEICFNNPFCDTGLFCPQTYECISEMDICVRRKDNKGTIYGCPNGAHLLNCDNMECSGYFKCHSSYCIAVNYVCDGDIDCLTGEDEEHCSNMTCPGLFMCPGESHCLPQSLVCDGHVDCSLTAEDELLCQSCHKKCVCTAHTAICNTHHNNLTMPLRISTLTLSTFDVENQENLNIPGVIYVDVSGNPIVTLRPFFGRRVKFLVASFCRIKYISHTSKIQSVIQRLLLGNNEIEEIVQYHFLAVPRLQSVDLSHNFIKNIRKRSFVNLYNLINVILIGNPLISVSSKAVIPLKHVTLYLSEHDFCCQNFHHGVECLALENHTACNSLIEQKAVSTYVATCSSIIIFLVFICFCFRLSMLTITNKEFDKMLCNTIVLNLLIADTVHLIYYIIISTASSVYGKTFEAMEYSWISSIYCDSALMIYHIGKSESLWISLGMSVHRLIMVKAKLGTTRDYRLKKIARSWIISGWVFFCILWTCHVNLKGNTEGHDSATCLCIGRGSDHVIITSNVLDGLFSLGFSMINVTFLVTLHRTRDIIGHIRSISKFTYLTIILLSCSNVLRLPYMYTMFHYVQLFRIRWSVFFYVYTFNVISIVINIIIFNRKIVFRWK